MCGLPAASLVAGAAFVAAVDGPGGGAAAGAGVAAIDGLAPSTAARAEPCSGSPTTKTHPPKSQAATAARPPKASPMFNRSIGGPPLRCRHSATSARAPISRIAQAPLFRAEQCSSDQGALVSLMG